MEEQLRNLIKVWISVFISISYCYYISSKISKGFVRLLSLLPIFIIFLLLFGPLPLHLRFLPFMARKFQAPSLCFRSRTFKPLPSNLSCFFCFACFPIKTKQYSSSNRIYNEPLSKWVIAFKVMIVFFLLHIYGNNYHTRLPQFAFLAILIIHAYLELEQILVFVRALLSTLLGCELEPVFNEPYLATSLQDFWSRRWNLMVPAILRPTVHIPVQRFSARLLGPNLTFYAGVLVTFLVSGLMHELIYFYIIRKSPTWEITWFFVLHGVVTSAEIAVKRMRWLPPPHRAVSGLAVWAFMFVTAGWLFCPQVLRNDVHERLINECLLVIDIVRRTLSLY